MPHFVHKHCTEEQFKNAKTRLKEIEKRLCTYVPGFHPVGQERTGSDEILAMSIVKRENKETRDIGILFDDAPLAETFTFYAAKSVRAENELYFRKEDIASAVSLSEIEKGLEGYCKLALQKLNEWKVEDLSKM
jgi:tetrahydromethanopterin S-methyltransferase subunit G